MQVDRTILALDRRRAMTLALSGMCALIPSTATGAEKGEAQAYSWSVVPYGGGGYVDGFLYHPNERGLLYARTDVGGMYRYDYSSRRWIALLDHLPHADGDLMGVLSMAIDPKDPDRLYAACGLYLADWARKGAILRSSDRGRTWNKTELPLRIGGNADGRGTGDRLVVDPGNPQILYYGSNQDGLWKSIDRGESFSKVAAAPSKSFSLVIFHPRNGEIYLGSADGKGGLFVSRDDGASFAKVEGTPAQVPQHAVFAADGTFYVTFAQGDEVQPVNPSSAVRGGVWKRDPSSSKWREISPIRTDEQNRFGYSGIDVGPDGLLVVSTLDRWWPQDDIFVSRDGGGRWSALSGQAKFDASPYPWLAETNTERKMGGWLSDLRINPFDPDEMIYGHGGGLWMSRNLKAAGIEGPVLFDASMTGFEEGAITQLASPTGGATLLAAEGDSAGAAWDDITKPPGKGLFRPNTESNFSIDYAGQKPGFLVRSVANSRNYGFYSKDSGVTWFSFGASPVKKTAGNQNWVNPGIIVISSHATALLWAPDKDMASYSTDGGSSWMAAKGWPATPDQSLTPLSDKVVDGVFYVHDRTGGQILISVDKGASFLTIAKGLPTVAPWERAQLAVVPTRMRDLWLALPSYLLHSRDADTPFKPIKDVTAAWAVSFGAPAVKGGYPAVFLYGIVNGSEGLWRSDDDGSNWIRINDDAHRFGNIHAMSGDPLEYGTLYLAPDGRGILVGRPKHSSAS
jgi:hypothetical protein